VTFHKKLKTCYISDCWSIFKSTTYTLVYVMTSISCTLENGLTVQNILSFYNMFFIFCGTLPSDPPNFFKLFFSDLLQPRNKLSCRNNGAMYRYETSIHRIFA
jgi:hypothetical protein